MRQSPRFLIGAASAVVFATCFVAGLEASRQLTTLGIAAGSPAAASTIAPIVPNEVNRTLKGDRQRVIVLPDGAEPFDVQVPPPKANPKPQLPDGCETALSRTSPTPGARPARCVT